MKLLPQGSSSAPAIDALLVAIRPKLHRYCARMVGSVIDGEDVLQDAMIKAIQSFASAGPLVNPEGWLFRIAHNTAVDFLRRRRRQDGVRSDEEPDMMGDPADAIASREIARTSLRTFMRLPLAQRSSVILMDVLGCSLQELCEVMDSSLPAVKAALHRGRARLRELAAEPDDTPHPKLSVAERDRLGAYADRFNAHDFDAVRAMIADDIRLDLVNRAPMNGKAEVSRYFGNYAQVADWHMVPGLAEGRPAILVLDPGDDRRPKYFILLNWSAGRVAAIRDFRHASYIVDGADFQF